MVQQRPDNHSHHHLNNARPARGLGDTLTAADASSSSTRNLNDNALDGGGENDVRSVQLHQYNYNHLQQQRRRRESVDIFSETISIGSVTDLSAGERPITRDTTHTGHSVQLMRDASVLSGQPDKSNFREKLRHWTVLEDSNSPLLAPRPTTSLASQKPSGQLLVSDVQREMTFLMSRPSTSNFPAKPKELIEPLDGLLPSESPVTQKKFLVLPSIGGGLRRQRSNLETVNQLDYSRHDMEDEVDFFAGYGYNSHSTKSKPPAYSSSKHKHHHHQRQTKHSNYPKNNNSNNRPSSPTRHRPQHHTGLHKSGNRSTGIVHHSNYPLDLRESPSKAADTPMPLPPIPKHHPKHPGWRAGFGSKPDRENRHPTDEGETSSSASGSSPDLNTRLEDNIYDTDLEEVDEEEEEEEDLDRFRQRTPETYRTGSPSAPFTPPPGFR